VTAAQDFVAAARSLVGTPWRHRGRGRRGIDCVGLVVVSARAAGLKLDDATHYGRYPWDDRLRKELQANFGDPVAEPQVGDVALICWNKLEPSHVAIFGDYLYGGLSLIHCENLSGCIEQSLPRNFADIIVEVYRPWPVKSSP
jgi:hypothetical protein